MKKKTLIVLLSMVLALSVGGTTAWAQALDDAQAVGEATARAQALDEPQDQAAAQTQAEQKAEQKAQLEVQKAEQARQEALAKALYEVAKKNIYDKSYEAAISQFNELAAQYAQSHYSQEALYWLGYSLDKYAATVADVKQGLYMRQAAIAHLETLLKKYPANTWAKDAKILELQIAEELVRSGLGKYRQYIDQGVLGGVDEGHLEMPEPPEPPDSPIPPKPLDPDTELKLVALDALMGMDEEKAFPILEKMALGEKRPELREKALFILSQSDTTKVVPILINIAEKDPSPEMRKKAIFWLGQRDEETALAALIKIYETSNAESKDILLMAFAESDNPKGLAKITEIAKTEKDPEIRSKALFWLGQAEGEKAMPILLEAYKTTDNVKIKQQIIMSLAQSDGTKAVPALIDLARKETNFELKKQIIFWLGQSDNPEAAKFLQELIEK
ncbi:MAG: HEAT repeat domain-containing protein [Candidatus Aminicenantes bacterium]|nr:HEAT repeat domain-containing protein [Candidatus Aminicenantes bacterium]